MLEVLFPVLAFLVGVLFGAGFAVHNTNKTKKFVEQLQKESSENLWKLVQSIDAEIKRLESRVIKQDKKVN